MPGIIFKGDDFVGIQDAKRRAIYEAEQMAAKMGVTLTADQRTYIIAQVEQQLAQANVGWDINAPETVVRTDRFGTPRIIPKNRAVGWAPGLPASPDTRDASSRGAQVGRTKRINKKVFFPDPGEILPVSPREAAARFHARIVGEMERTGYIPAALREELAVTGWKIGQPVPREKVDEWCSNFQTEFHNKHGRQ